MALDDPRHPDAERLAEYADGVLDAGARADIQRHLADCDDCRFVVMETMAYMENVAFANRVRTDTVVLLPGRKWMTRAAAVVAVAATLALAVRITHPAWLFGRPDVRPELRELVAAVALEPTRPVEGRLTGGFTYAPPPSPTRGSGDREPSPDVRIALANIEKAHQQHNSPETESALGVAYLVAGRFGDAVTTLEHAASEKPDDALIESDLSAAYLTRAIRQNQSQDWPACLAAAERALKAQPTLAEAHFNRAIALAELHLPKEARRAADDYRRLGGDAEWANELDRRIVSVSVPQSRLLRSDLRSRFAAQPDQASAVTIVASDAQVSRELVEDDYLPTWADAWLGGDANAASVSLTAARVLANALATQAHDTIALRSVDAVDHAREPVRRDLARGFQLWREARQAYAENKPSRFGALFEDARRAFETGNSPMALWCRHYHYVRFYFDGDLVGAERVALGVQTDAAPLRSAALGGRIEWDLGSIAFQRARFGEAVEHFLRSLADFQAVGERDNIAAMHQSLAESYGRLGNMAESWREHRLALTLSPTVQERRRLQGVFTGAGYTSLNAGLPEAAVHFFLEAGATADPRDANYVFESEVGAGRAFAEMKDDSNARGHLERAAAVEPAVTNKSYKARFGADMRLAFAEIAERGHRADEVIQLTDEVLERVESVASEYRIARLHLLRSRARRQMANFDAAQWELEQGIKHLESKRALLQQDSQRISYLDTAWDLYADMVGLLALDRRHPDEALDWADRGRARALQDLLASVNPRGLRGTTEAVGEHDAILFLMMTDRGLFRWLKTAARGVEFAHEPSVGRRIEPLASLLTAPAPRPEQATIILRDGYDLFIRPFEESLNETARLIIVPDSTLQRVPFSALRDAVRRKYLIERMTVEISPSLATISSSTAVRTAVHRESVAVFVNPQTSDGGSSTALPSLPAANREADQISRLYARATMFSGPQATQGRLTEALRDYDVIHVATHAVVDSRDHDRVHLALADGDSALEFSGLTHHPRARVVVLAACRTATGPRSQGEGLMNLARPFLATGVNHAVVTLTDVPDDGTAVLMGEFHSQLSRGATPADALAMAQRASARQSGTSFQWWSAFVLVSVR